MIGYDSNKHLQETPQRDYVYRVNELNKRNQTLQSANP